MTNGNKTLNIQYRFLSNIDHSMLLETNLEAFSDYIVPLQVTEKQFENHLAQNNIKLDLSVGAFKDDNLVGYTLNGFGLWNGKQTAYDGGTGVIPNYRRMGIGKSMFEFLLPKLREIGVEQMLLEVISNNTKAVNLYRKLGFLETRRLLMFEQTNSIEPAIPADFEIRQVESLDWQHIQTFWDKQTSWQFSIESVKRKLSPKILFGAFIDDKCVGYSILYQSTGTISQIAVEKEFREKKIATMLLAEMQKYIEKDKKLRFSNVDRELNSLIRFAGSLDFTPTISQFEMILDL